MRVFVVPAWFPSDREPRKAKWIEAHLKALKVVGIEYCVLHVDYEPKHLEEADPPPVMNGPNLFCRRLPTPRSRLLRTRFVYPLFLERYIAALAELVESACRLFGPPTLIHAHVSLPAGYAASELGRRYGIPVVVTEHYSGFANDAKYWWRLGHFVPIMRSRIAQLYAVSPWLAERMAQSVTIPLPRILPNPIDTRLFQIRERRESSGVFRICTAGLSHTKGTDILYSALGQLGPEYDWELDHFGQVPAGFTESLSPRIGARINLMGAVGQEVMADRYSQADLYVVASRIETANVSMLEAMACGVPVIATRCGGPETLLTPDVATMVPSGDSQALAGAIRLAERTRRFGRIPAETLRRYVVENYSIEVIGARLLQEYAQVVGRGGCSPVST